MMPSIHSCHSYCLPSSDEIISLESKQILANLESSRLCLALHFDVVRFNF